MSNIEEKLKQYIDAIEKTNDFFKKSNQMFEELLDEHPQIRERWHLLQQQRKFAEQVDEALDGRYSRYKALKVCDTPDILLQAGFAPLPMLFTQKHLERCLHPKSDKNSHYHGLTTEQIKKMPYLIAEPVMIYDSLSRKDSVVIVTSEVDCDMLPVFISIHPNGNGNYELQKIPSNFITSIYGKDNFNSHISRVVAENKMLYCNKQKSQELFSVLQLQLLQGFNSLGFDIIIRKSQNIVNQDMNLSSDRGGQHDDEQEIAATGEKKNISESPPTVDKNVRYMAKRK